MPVKITTRKTQAGKTRYMARYSTPDGSWLSAGTFGSKSEARKQGAIAEHKANQSRWVDPRKGTVTFASFVTSTYLPSTEVLEVTTQDGIKHYLHRHLVPAFGAREMGKIRPTDVQKWISSWTTRGTHSPATIVKAHSILHKIFAWAVRDGIVPINPCAETDLPTVPEPTVKIMTIGEFEAFFSALTGTRERAIARLAIETGMRWSEVVGFTAGQMLLGNRIVVDRALTQAVVKNNGYRWKRKPYPKGRTSRTIVVSPECISLLTQYLNEVGGRQCACCPTRDLPDREIFLTAAGTHLDGAAWREEYLKPAMRTAGLADKRYTFKHFRSSFCSWLLDRGVPLPTVQKLMGHKNLSTTQRYVQVLPNAEEEAAAALNEMWAEHRREA